MNAFICNGVSEDCLNPYDSYGEICVHCNACGRDDKTTMYDCQIKLYTEKLQEEKQKLNDSLWNESQRRCVESNVAYFGRMLSTAIEDKEKEDTE